MQMDERENNQKSTPETIAGAKPLKPGKSKVKNNFLIERDVSNTPALKKDLQKGIPALPLDLVSMQRRQDHQDVSILARPNNAAISDKAEC